MRQWPRKIFNRWLWKWMTVSWVWACAFGITTSLPSNPMSDSKASWPSSKLRIMFTATIESERVLESEWQRETKREDKHRQRHRREQEWGSFYSLIYPFTQRWDKGSKKEPVGGPRWEQVWGRGSTEVNTSFLGPPWRTLLQNQSTPRETNRQAASWAFSFLQSTELGQLFEPPMRHSLDGYEQPAFVLFSHL